MTIHAEIPKWSFMLFEVLGGLAFYAINFL